MIRVTNFVAFRLSFQRWVMMIALWIRLCEKGTVRIILIILRTNVSRFSYDLATLSLESGANA